MDPIIIIGSGLAGYTVARELRKLDAASPLTLICADDGHFYSKPNLSNAFKQGKGPDTLINASRAQMVAQLHARILHHTTVSAIEPAARQLRCDAGVLRYSRLVLAVGADPIRLPLAGDGAQGVLSVNSLQDYTTFRARLEGKRQVVILGAGLIGCEFANDLAVAGGYRVTVIDPAPWPLSRLVPEPLGRDLQRALAAHGVDWRLDNAVDKVERDRRDSEGYRLHLQDGEELEADLVLSAVGLKPRTALAAKAGLEVGRGILVDRLLATSTENVYALGDCAEVAGLVLPYVMPIMHAGRALAQTLAGTPTPVVYPAMPVVVKTFSHPTVVAPPAPGAAGQWQCEAVDGGMRARFLGSGGELLGFALSGAASAEKQALTRLLPPLLA
ncbi:MAG TPA: FAD-dependent oxidoreductase [Candidatus Competibacteraceae bacterium]|nr:FAD-dependent oxidoreductase [Candidatus Competibacteraceae bacterium]